MGWRFRRSARIGPFRITATRRGLSTSVGVPGARIGVNSRGQVRATTGLPGTGIYATEIIGQVSPGARESAPAGDQESAASGDRESAAAPTRRRRGVSGKTVTIVIMGVVIVWLLAVLVLR